MATKPAKASGVRGKGGNSRRVAGTLKSPLAPTGAGPSGGVDDVSVAAVRKGTLRPKQGGIGGSDAALGSVGKRIPKATTAGAQFRVTMKLPGAVAPEARPTLANGRTVPPVMGSKQRRNFDAQSSVLY